MNQSVLPQLRSVEAELASQESQLTEQLASVREKLSGIRAVMPMFSGTADSASELDTAKELPTADELEADVPAVEEPEAAGNPEPTKAKAAASKKAVQKKKTTQKKATTKKAAAKTATAKKTDGRAADWQKYTRPGVKNQSIPDAVKLVLATQPEKEFKIAEVMEALFKEDMPKAQYLKARNRISNVLSGGVRAGDWHRGESSTYRMTAA